MDPEEVAAFCEAVLSAELCVGFSAVDDVSDEESDRVSDADDSKNRNNSSTVTLTLPFSTVCVKVSTVPSFF